MGSHTSWLVPKRLWIHWWFEKIFKPIICYSSHTIVFQFVYENCMIHCIKCFLQIYENTKCIIFIVQSISYFFSVISVSAWIANWLFLKPYWLLCRISFWSRKWERNLWTNFSKILLIFEVSDNWCIPEDLLFKNWNHTCNF